MNPLYCSQGHANAIDSRFCRLCGEVLNSGGAVNQATIGGQVLGWRYQVVRELGHGGFGRTYLATDTHRFNELCVLKEFAPQMQGSQALEKAQELFSREAGILYQLQHPQIPRFRELFRAEVQGQGKLFLVQDYVAGQTYQALLQARLQQGQRFTEPEVTQLLLDLLPVLGYIHSLGVVHRDISPDNLMQRDVDSLPILIDFGGVKQVAAEVMSAIYQPIAPTATRLGKIGYAPAEQMEDGEVFPHSDLYALAVTVLVLLTGQQPLELFQGDRRRWQRQVKLSPTLSSVLDKMLDPYPERRFQSAQAVLVALQGQTASPVNWEYTQPPIAYQHQIPDPDLEATATNYNRVAEPTTPHLPSPRRSSGWLTPLIFLLMAGATVGGIWFGARDFLPLPHQPTTPPTTDPIDNGATDPEFSQAEQQRKQDLNQRRSQLGIDNSFLAKLVNQAFYERHPELAGRQLSTGPEDEGLRAAWDKIALQYLDDFQTLSAEARSRLGQYTTADVSQRQTAVNQLNLSSRALNDLTDAQFFYLFPDQPRDQNLLQQPIGQVWQAIATDQLKALKSGSTLERIQFQSGNFSHQVTGRLQPGAGKAYTAKFSQDQVLRLRLQAPNQSIRLSLYPPTSQSPPLLDHAQETEWSGKLTATGLYEIVVVSDTNQSVDYAIDVAAADDVTTPNSEPSPPVSPSPTPSADPAPPAN
ncbi:protein kinase domain-containing protein [Pantanalinema sp. GBBB05]|uniref:protein kinase domain-containing protein n=1 Tax=Pantanalinema sp. GBBB05 TaxID=2604139 RepID=UPI001DF5517D|nr:serine/threonine protein kinase [Pantanalinema sp. GBBB05]